MTGDDVSVVFTPAGVGTTVPTGTSILDAARAVAVDLDSTCGGRGLCGRCQVTPSLGEFAKWGINSQSDSLGPPTAAERAYRGRRPLGAQNRLGCQARVRADVVVDVPAESQVHRPVVRKRIDLPGLTIDPLVNARYVELPDPELGDERAEADLLVTALEAEWGVEGARIDARVLPALHTSIVAGDRGVTAIVHTDATVLSVRPGFDEALYGIAIDVGSTTIAGYLVDLGSGEIVGGAGRMNPQIRFGEDLMSRVSYVMMNPGGQSALTSVVREALDALIDELAADAILDAPALRTRIHDLVVVGNPIMHHLLLGIDPTPLGTAPFTLAVRAPVDLRADEIGLDLPFARVHVGPCIAGHVGADAAAATLNEGTHRAAAPQLLVDIGTNAEIILGTGPRTLAASSPTGPAFEGAQISCGMRATAGAIERVRIDPDTFEPRFKVIGAELWSDDPGFDAATSHLDIAGLCGSAIVEVIGEMLLAGICDRDGVIRGELASRTQRVQADGRTFRFVIRDGDRALHITQNDVRQIQLAAAALRAGIDLLLEHADLDGVEDIRLAGAFGAHLDPLYALILGLVPDCPADSVRAVGNAAGAGAVRMLVAANQRTEIAEAVGGVEKIETATEPRFQELFVAAMAFPHATAPTPHLDAIVNLPAPPAPAVRGRGRRRRSTGKES